MKRLTTLAAATLALAGGSADAAEAAYDFVVCSHGKRTPIVESADAVAFGVESWGVVASSTTRQWENASQYCQGTLRIAGGRPVGKGLCKWVDAENNTALGEWEVPASGEPTWTWLAGSGKLKGISGGGTFRDLFSAPPASPGSSQGCRRDWGKLTLP